MINRKFREKGRRRENGGCTATLRRVSSAGGGHIECSERDICFRWARWAELCVPSVGGCPFGSSAGYLPIYLSPAARWTRAAYCAWTRACMRDSVIPPRYWWCVALFIAASPLSRRRGPLHTNRSLARKRRSPLSLSSLSPATGKRGCGGGCSFTRVNAPCVRYVEEYYAVATRCASEQRIFYDPGTPGIKTARRTVRRTSIGTSRFLARTVSSFFLCS